MAGMTTASASQVRQAAGRAIRQRQGMRSLLNTGGMLGVVVILLAVWWPESLALSQLLTASAPQG
jgi:hypothetical protein